MRALAAMVVVMVDTGVVRGEEEEEERRWRQQELQLVPRCIRANGRAARRFDYFWLRLTLTERAQEHETRVANLLRDRRLLGIRARRPESVPEMCLA